MLQVATLQLTDAQIKALPTTGIEIVADPGANAYLIPVLAVMEFSRVGGGVYTNVSQENLNQGASDIAISWGNNNVVAFRPAPMEGFGPAHGTKRTAICPAVAPISDPIVITDFLFASVYGNLPVNNAKNFMIIADNAGGNFTGGGAANTLTVTVYYLTRTFGSLTN